MKIEELNLTTTMEEQSEVVIEFQYFRIYKDGRIDRLLGEEIVPPTPEAESGVRSKDVVVSPESGLSARLFLPEMPDPTRRVPLVVFLHGGAFCIETPFSPRYHRHGVDLAADADAIILSVHYRRAPEHPLPIAYDDTWDALRWTASHVGGTGPEAWLNDHVDFGRVFLVGASAGATLAHYAARRAGLEGGPCGLHIFGVVLVHPFFGNDQPDKLIQFIYPTNTGSGDPKLNPGMDPELGRLGCGRVLVFVAEKDFLKDRGLAYYEALKKSEWKGKVEIVESKGEDHTFHLFNPNSENAIALMNMLVSFVKHE